MFERYTEHARRTVFCARHEASALGSAWIEAEHILLGLLKEDWILGLTLPAEAGEAIRAKIEHLPSPSPPIPTSVDLPLSRESCCALAFAAEEANLLNHPSIEACHLTLGLLRIESCMAADLIREYGINTDTYRTIASGSLPAARTTAQGEAPILPAAPRLGPLIATLEQLVEKTRAHLKRHADAYGEQRLKRKPWRRKEAMGHLVDWAAIHQVWIARALTEPKLTGAGYPQDDCVAAQQYGNYRWQEIVDLWVSLNRLLVHVLAQIPDEKLNMPCRVGLGQPVPLSALIARYVQHCEDVAGQMLPHL